jgi:hypothetical protein
MVELIINKILMMAFCFAVLNSVRHGYYFIQAYLLSTLEEPKQYKISKISLIVLGVSLSYILSSILTGIMI